RGGGSGGAAADGADAGRSHSPAARKVRGAAGRQRERLRQQWGSSAGRWGGRQRRGRRNDGHGGGSGDGGGGRCGGGCCSGCGDEEKEGESERGGGIGSVENRAQLVCFRRNAAIRQSGGRDGDGAVSKAAALTTCSQEYINRYRVTVRRTVRNGF
ncbi:unnamed protein product, partial [Phaeothamnion confervicola]